MGSDSESYKMLQERGTEVPRGCGQRRSTKSCFIALTEKSLEDDDKVICEALNCMKPFNPRLASEIWSRTAGGPLQKSCCGCSLRLRLSACSCFKRGG